MLRRVVKVARSLIVALVLLVLVAGCGGGGETAPSAEPATTEATVTSETVTSETVTSETSAREPSFDLQDGEFVPMAQVKQAMDEGAKLIVIDSRVPELFVGSHIPGAISIPFYEIDERYAELPKDTWIVAYCSCPTAEAEAAVEVLRARGYEKTAVLLEGYPAWVEAGYPTTGTGA